jgi:hypothetical protein
MLVFRSLRGKVLSVALLLVIGLVLTGFSAHSHAHVHAAHEHAHAHGPDHTHAHAHSHDAHDAHTVLPHAHAHDHTHAQDEKPAVHKDHHLNTPEDMSQLTVWMRALGATAFVGAAPVVLLFFVPLKVYQ